MFYHLAQYIVQLCCFITVFLIPRNINKVLYVGAIAGAFYGHEIANKNLLKHCEGSDKMLELADKLYSLSSAVS